MELMKNMTSLDLNKSKIVEVNDVSFQTQIQSIIPTPLLPCTNKFVTLGIYITNNTSNCLYFERLDSLSQLPILIDCRGNLIEIDSDMLRLRVKGNPYYLVAPGESSFFKLESFIWRMFCKLHLKIYNEAGGFFHFYDLKPGKYKLQISYKRTDHRQTLLPKESPLAVAWIGDVTIPFVDFCIA
ncbi:MAG: hypothetical protein EAZ87_08350 [Nostocales cyanobacterium]|nr:MAG: hypothetical protein EAZ87_08350 [Nostocales cyanobacterium]